VFKSYQSWQTWTFSESATLRQIMDHLYEAPGSVLSITITEEAPAKRIREERSAEYRARNPTIPD
jgi:hypothetical protein